MAWSTRELAELTGVTLRSIRHWHDVGLLPEPERRSNGYKQYTARELVLALRIARLSGLGFGLDEVGRMLRADEHGTELSEARREEPLRELRAELETRIAALERTRAEVDDLIARGSAPDLSPEALATMEALGGDLTSRNVAIVLAHLTPKADLTRFVEAVRAASPDEFGTVNSALLALPADASEAEVAALADRAVAALEIFFDAHPDAFGDLVDGSRSARDSDILTEVVAEHMNQAQQRAMQLIVERVGRER